MQCILCTCEIGGNVLRVGDEAGVEGAHAGNCNCEEDEGEGLLLVLVGHPQHDAQEAECRPKMGYCVEYLEVVLQKQTILKFSPFWTPLWKVYFS